MELQLIMINNFIKKETGITICWNLMDLLDMQNLNLIVIIKEKKIKDFIIYAKNKIYYCNDRRNNKLAYLFINLNIIIRFKRQSLLRKILNLI